MIEKPLFLTEGNVKKLNDKMLRNAGQFCFLKTNQTMLTDKVPSSYIEAFQAYVTGLYSLYHDYGRKFLFYSLNQGGSLPVGNEGKSGQDAGKRVTECRRHLKVVNEVFRPNLVHGIFEGAQKNEFMEQLNLYRANTESVSMIWPQYVNQLRNQDWEKIVKRLVSEADKFYELLEQVADMWKDATDEERKKNRKQFAESNEFTKSIDIPLCESIYRAEELEDKEEIGDYIEEWRKMLSSEFISQKADTPEKVYGCLKRSIKGNAGMKSSAEIGARYGFLA